MSFASKRLEKLDFRRYRYTALVAVAMLVIAILGMWLENRSFFSQPSERITFYGFSLTIITIILAIRQSATNHDWNRRHTASTSLLEIKEKLDPKVLFIHEKFNYMCRDENDTIKPREIHDQICLKNGNDFVRDDTTRLYKLKDEDDAKKIYRSIWETLNLYEHIAANVYHGIYDKAFVADLMKSNIIKVASVFSEYIAHVNEHMYPNRKGEIWKNIRALGEEFKKEYRDVPSSAKARPRT